MAFAIELRRSTFMPEAAIRLGPSTIGRDAITKRMQPRMKRAPQFQLGHMAASESRGLDTIFVRKSCIGSTRTSRRDMRDPTSDEGEGLFERQGPNPLPAHLPLHKGPPSAKRGAMTLSDPTRETHFDERQSPRTPMTGWDNRTPIANVRGRSLNLSIPATLDFGHFVTSPERAPLLGAMGRGRTVDNESKSPSADDSRLGFGTRQKNEAALSSLPPPTRTFLTFGNRKVNSARQRKSKQTEGRAQANLRDQHDALQIVEQSKEPGKACIESSLWQGHSSLSKIVLDGEAESSESSQKNKFVPMALRARTVRAVSQGTSGHDIFDFHGLHSHLDVTFDRLRFRRPSTVFQGTCTFAT